MDQNDLKRAVVALSTKPRALEAVANNTLHRMAELGFVQWGSEGWELTGVGWELLPKLRDGDEVEI